MGTAPGRFRLRAPFAPTGNQPEAIERLVAGLEAGAAHQVLLGVTGSGKTFTMANVAARAGCPTLVIAPNKTLAAQLFAEFRQLFPENAVEYFVSYYDYYQPEAYLPASDTYIEKESSINERIDALRHSATRSLLERDDVIIVATVSCIYGLGSPEAYREMTLPVAVGERRPRAELLARLVELQYTRNELDFKRGTFRTRGDVVDVYPAHAEDEALRLEFFGDELESLAALDPLRGVARRPLSAATIYPASHYVTPAERLERAIAGIEAELEAELPRRRGAGQLLEAQRLEQRTRMDLEMLRELGYCPGIENYSRHLTGRRPGEPPPTLMEYLPGNALVFIDESHVTVPQLGGMYKGDRSRKETLVAHGFRLPSALDNRPLRFAEFNAAAPRLIYVSATPGAYEQKKAAGRVVEQLVRPTGLLDPPIEVRPAAGQVDDLLGEARQVAAAGGRVLVTTLTKRMAEELTEYFGELGLRVRYLHSDIDTLERTDIIRRLRLGEFDVLVGVNLLREGLDLPEVMLVALLDADKEGFLRSTRSLIQTCGRAARNLSGRVLMYADTVTGAMRAAREESDRRRRVQSEYNREHGITPESTRRAIDSPLGELCEADYVTVPRVAEPEAAYGLKPGERQQLLRRLRREMRQAADRLEFERAAELRDRLRALEAADLGLEEKR